MTEPGPNRNYVPALGYHWLTRFYDAIVGTTTREKTFKNALISQSNLASGHQILDLASGTGTLAIWMKLSQPTATVTGVDGDPAILSLAKQKAQKAGVHINFDHGFSTCLPYQEERFDRIVSSLFFHHLSWENKTLTAREMFRVLKHGGEIHVADWGRAENPLMRGLFFAIQMLAHVCHGKHGLDGLENTQDNVSGKLIVLFENAGFSEVVQRETFSTIFGTMALYSAVKNS